MDRELWTVSLGLLTLSLGLVAGFYLVTARFWVYAQGRRLAGLLSSFFALCLYVVLARLVPVEIRYWGGSLLALLLTAAVLWMGWTMLSDWRAAGSRRETHNKKEPSK